MEGGHSETQQGGEREDINCAARQLGPGLLRYCVITGLLHRGQTGRFLRLQHWKQNTRLKSSFLDLK